MIVEVHGLELSGRHGVNEDERREIAEPKEDAIEATIDYRRVRDIVRDINDAESYQLLETLAAAIADALNAELRVNRVRVGIRKPGIAWAEWTGVICERP
jgi:dihydroneopterin aldolase